MLNASLTLLNNFTQFIDENEYCRCFVHGAKTGNENQNCYYCQKNTIDVFLCCLGDRK